MFRRLEDFRVVFTQSQEGVMKLLAAIPDSAAEQAVAPGHRTLRRLAFHLVETLIEMPARTGLQVDGAAAFLAGQAPILPDTLEEIRKAYETAASGLLKALEAWTDADLEVEDDMYGMKWKRGVTLGILLSHQTHHVGQITVLMRQAGLVVPGLCGPAKEEWAQYGMPDPAI